MPFIEILGPSVPANARIRAAADMTKALSEAYGISENIITTFFQHFEGHFYAHAGKTAVEPSASRIFVKIHAFPRPVGLKRDAALALTRAGVAAFGCAPSDLIIYFLETHPESVAHSGTLQSDT